MTVNLTNGKTLQIIRIIAESTLATQVELANPKGQIIFIQNEQIKSITN
jgi:hypothetical protein